VGAAVEVKGVGVSVGVSVGMAVGGSVGVLVAGTIDGALVSVGSAVGVPVGVGVGGSVGVIEGVAVGIKVVAAARTVVTGDLTELTPSEGSQIAKENTSMTTTATTMHPRAFARRCKCAVIRRRQSEWL